MHFAAERCDVQDTFCLSFSASYDYFGTFGSIFKMQYTPEN